MTYELRLITRNDPTILSRPLHTVDFCHALKLMLRRRRLLLTTAAQHHTSGLVVYSALSARGRDTEMMYKNSPQKLTRLLPPSLSDYLMQLKLSVGLACSTVACWISLSLTTPYLHQNVKRGVCLRNTVRRFTSITTKGLR